MYSPVSAYDTASVNVKCLVYEADFVSRIVDGYVKSKEELVCLFPNGFDYRQQFVKELKEVRFRVSFHEHLEFIFDIPHLTVQLLNSPSIYSYFPGYIMPPFPEKLRPGKDLVLLKLADHDVSKEEEWFCQWLPPGVQAKEGSRMDPLSTPQLFFPYNTSHYGCPFPIYEANIDILTQRNYRMFLQIAETSLGNVKDPFATDMIPTPVLITLLPNITILGIEGNEGKYHGSMLEQGFLLQEWNLDLNVMKKSYDTVGNTIPYYQNQGGIPF